MPTNQFEPGAAGPHDTAAALPEAIRILAELVGFNTVSHNSNLDCISFIEAFLLAAGARCARLPNADGTKASLMAELAGSGAAPSPAVDHRTAVDPLTATPGAVALSAHTDVVPVEGQDWSSDPFTLRQADGRLYGRGTTDMKGFAACMLASVSLFTQRRLRRPIQMLFTYDEEIGCFGVRPLAEKLANGADFAPPGVVIVGEPTSMAVVTAHKGACRLRTTVRGREAHSSRTTQGVNAVEYASRFVAHLRDVERDLARQVPGPQFEPPFSTLHVGRMSGGEALNIVPTRCVVDWEIRAVPGVDALAVLEALAAWVDDHLHPDMHAVDPATGITTEVTNNIAPFASDGMEGPAGRLATAMVGANAPQCVSYMTEAPFFQLAGMSSVVCGPGHIAQAHTADEYIEIAQLDACLRAMERLADVLTVVGD